MLTENQSREHLRTWLAPPNPSINHNTACGTQHDGTAKWFIHGGTFDEWKKSGSLLWIRGNRKLLFSCSLLLPAEGFSVFLAGTGKSILWYAVLGLPRG